MWTSTLLRTKVGGWVGAWVQGCSALRCCFLVCAVLYGAARRGSAWLGSASAVPRCVVMLAASPGLHAPLLVFVGWTCKGAHGLRTVPPLQATARSVDVPGACVVSTSLLNEIDAGLCEGMTYADVKRL